MKKVILVMMACAGLCACSNDDIELSGNQTFDSDVAYLKVKLSEVGSLTRGTDGGTAAGTAAECNVAENHFFFYDANGNYIAKGVIDGDATIDGENLVILEGVTNKTYPKYVVTVLNEPTGFEPATTLGEMEKKVSDIQDASSNFVMSTSSYYDSSRSFNCGVTEINEANFITSTEEIDNSKALKIYVERLASKVTVDINADLAATATSVGYKITQTLAGADNSDEAANGEAATDLYVQLTGWTLNATADDSYLLKNIDTSWDADALGFTWNDASNCRSYWCQSYNYGNSIDDTTGKVSGLTYNTLADATNAFGASVYCAENTTKDVTAKNSPALTSVVVSALVVDANDEPVSLIRYNGILFKAADFFATIGNENDIYADTNKTSLTEDDFNVTESKGVTTVHLKAGKYYDGQGNEFEIAVSNAIENTNKSRATDINQEITYYKDGLMYYNIPVEHIGNALSEGEYGIVRNHQYAVTINTLENLGNGALSDDTEIIPSNNDDEVVSYNVPATVEVLDWKLVNQGEDL